MCSLCDMDKDVLTLIASSLCPPDVFALVTSSKRAFWSKRAPDPPLAVTLLQAALRRHLDVLLQDLTVRTKDCSPFTIQDLFPEEEREKDFDASGRPQVSRRGEAAHFGFLFSFVETTSRLFQETKTLADLSTHAQVLLSGSLAVQSALGVIAGAEAWKRCDVDIFCTWDAAPAVRQRLVERCGLICSGVDNDYLQSERDLAGDVEDGSLSAVHHVESYAARPTEGVSEFYQHYEVHELDYSSEEYYEQATNWGAEVLAIGQDRPHSRHRAHLRANLPALFADANPVPTDIHIYESVGLPGGSAGGIFPYDFDLRRNKTIVQLIIGKPSKKDARALLESFDLEICKCSFDGHAFRVPAPADTFAHRTACTPARRDLVQDFIITMLALEPSTIGDMFEVLAQMNEQSWAGIGFGAFEYDSGSEPSMGNDPYWRFQGHYRIITSLIERMQKYARRGVTIVDAPDGALDWVIDYCRVDYR